MRKSTLFIGLSLLIASCSTPSSTAVKPKPGEPNTASTIQPIPGLEVPIRTFEVSATEKSTITLPNGGSIEIPAHAFVDAKGKALSGTVEIEWQEYHSLTDILFSGIPMDYDSAGVQTALQSGGMFTIHGKQNDQAITIAPDKQLGVNLASNNNQKQFNFYSLDEKSGTWDYKTTAMATPNPTAKPGEEVKEVDNSKYYSLKLYASFKRDSFPELNHNDILAWEVLKADITPKQLSELNNNRNQAHVIGKVDNMYQLEIKNKSGTQVLNAHPVTFESKAFSQDNAKKTIQETEEAIAEFQQLNVQGKLIRSMDIPNFGTFNWDCMYHREHDEIFVNMTVPGEKMSELAAFFFVVPGDGIVIPISNSEKLNVPKNEACAVVAISTHNTVHAIPYAQIKGMLGKPKGTVNKIQLSPSKGILKNPSDMAALINLCV